MSAHNAGHSSWGMARFRLGWLAVAVAALTVMTGCQPSAPNPGPSSATSSGGAGTSAPGTTSAPAATTNAATGKVGHVFVINLENKG